MRHFARWQAALIGLVALMGCNAAQGGSCDPAVIGYAESRVGIDYRKLIASPIAEILSRGEAERLAGAEPVSKSDLRALGTEWRALVTGLLAGSLPGSFTGTSEPSMDTLRIMTPSMLALLQKCGPDADPRLAYLRDITLELGAQSE